ncbi:uncharacterized protein LOC111044846 [Nilaparvata lugens]|uniref:uncharacterized protein LOC111044846 n=1 Tax=Nilaparvata lugens TaxID=108931 RepID=UPI000B99C851|nr:uncharacterized protein LOC111044846 [Nilaparvata lugens]
MAAQRSDSTPICRCRVLYLGSSVPHVTKDGLQGIQEPLRELYPEQGAIGAKGIDSWLSVWSNGLLLENVDENHKKVSRFFPIDTLHYCAAVRYVLVPEKSSSLSSSSQPRFLPLDSPFARTPNPSHPPLFAAILRRTTGIKVLECHTFICKREMAANALVRCCFHAYADSSYARHIDSGGNSNSVYGTLRNYNQPIQSNNIEKVEGWNRMAPSGSMLTLNSTSLQNNMDVGNHQSHLAPTPDNDTSIDDMSICNGDENHKIWAGSTKDISSNDRDYIYGECGGSTMRSTRSIRPRQIMNAPPPPPPPVKEEKKKLNKDKSKRKKGGPDREEMHHMMMNGTLMRPATAQGMNGIRSHSSMSGTMMRGAHMHPKGTILRPASSHLSYHPNSPPPPPLPPPMIMVPTTLPNPKRSAAQTLPHRPPKGSIMVPIHPQMVPPNFFPLPPHPMYLQAGRKPPKHYQVAMEEPIYMPSARPMSPVASYQPSHFPHEAYLMQQYATLYGTGKKKDKHDKNMVPMPMNGGNYSEEQYNHPAMHSKRGKESKKGKDRPQSMNGSHPGDDDDDESPFNSRVYRKKSKEMKNGRKSAHDNHDDENDGESPFNTGIYRRKGHLNERAFSYSIRQEHRSRSYGSLANLKFAPPPTLPINGNGSASPPGDNKAYYNGSVNKLEMKKEREIIQMMQDLELTGDELERCEVPAAVYQQQQQMHHPAKLRR